MTLQTFRYIITGAWVLLIGLLPFIVSSSLFFPYISGKNIFFRIIVEVLLVLWAVSALHDKTLRPRRSWLLTVFAGFVLWVGIADIMGVNPMRSFWSNFERMEGYITLLHLFALFLVSATTLTKELWYKLIGWSVIISGITWLQGMVEHAKDMNFRIDGAFGNPTYFAAYAMIHIFFAALLSIHYRVYRYFWGAFILLNFVTLFYTGTRGALLGFVGGAIVGTILYACIEWKKKKVRYTALSIFGVIFFGVVMLGLAKDTHYIATSPVLSRLGQLSHYVINFQFKEMIADVGRSRTAIWGIAWEGVKERPVFGWGQENFIQVFSKHYNPHIFDQEQWFDRTHNVFFDWLIAAGFLGLAGYLGLFAAMLWYLWRHIHFELYERILLTGLCVAYFIHTFFVFDNVTTYIYIMIIFAFVHVVVTTHRHHEEKKTKHISTHSAQVILAGTIGAIVLACVVNVPAVSSGSNLIKGLVYSYGPNNQSPTDQGLIESKKYFEKALEGTPFALTEIREQLVDASFRVMSSTVSVPTKIAYIDFINEQIQENVTTYPNDARIQYFAGVYYNSIGDTVKSIEYLENALAISSQKQTFMFVLADTYLRNGNKSKSLELYKRAFEVSPQFNEPRLRYADALIKNGDPITAEELFKNVPIESLMDSKYVPLLIEVNRYDVVAQIFEQRVKDNPTDVQNRVSLAAAYVKLEKRQEAITILESIARDVPQSKSQIDYFISEIRAGRSPVE